MDDLIGIEIGGTKLQIAGSRDGSIVRRWRANADRPGGGAAIRKQLEQGLAEVLAGGAAAAIGVGFGGPVDVGAGTISRSHQVAGWEGFPLSDWLKDLTGAAIVLENDANTAALGEAVHGAGRGMRSVFYVTLGSGVGGGFVIEQTIYHGRAPGEAEFGHLRLDRSGATVESRCAGWAVDQRLRAASKSSLQLAQLIGPNLGGEARHLPAALAAGEPAARAIIDELTDDLAFALSHVVHLVHPHMIVLGGGLSLVGEPLRDGVAGRLPMYAMEAFHPPPEVRLAALGEDAVPVGAIELARRERV